jgi:glycyl-tRNA synthetase beta subunit
MDKQQLHQMLEQLHAELSHTESVDAGDRELLKDLKADVQAILERADETSAEQYGSLSSRLSEIIKQYEISHPRLTWAMEEVLEILSRAGV